MATSRLKVLASQLQNKSDVQIRETDASDKEDRFKYYGEQAYSCLETRICGKKENIGLIKLKRPKVYNALSHKLLEEIVGALDKFSKDPEIRCVIITGNDKAFSVGADIKGMAAAVSFSDMYKHGFESHFGEIASFPKPFIAAVSGFCFGGGCEIALGCDIVYASEDAAFGQPEIRIGTIPGGGGTQRLSRAIGKAKAMEMILTGEPITARTALQYGLIADIFPKEVLLQQVISQAEKIARHSPIITSMAKDCVNRADETTLSDGLRYENRIFQSTFATKDRLEGMKAFIEKRKPQYTNE